MAVVLQALLSLLAFPFLIAIFSLHGTFAWYKFQVRGTSRVYPGREGFSSYLRETLATDVEINTEGSIIEYISSKGSKRLAFVTNRVGAHYEVVNELKKSFSLPIRRVSYHITGKYRYEELFRLINLLSSMQQYQVERVWEMFYENGPDQSYSIFSISELVYKNSDPLYIFITSKLMRLYGSLYFSLKEVSPTATGQVSSLSQNETFDMSMKVPAYRRISTHSQPEIPLSDKSLSGHSNSLPRGFKNATSLFEERKFMTKIDSASSSIHSLEYIPLPRASVSENVNNRAILSDFRQKLTKVLLNTNSLKSPALSSGLQAVSGDSHPILRMYIDGLKQLVVSGHPWVTNGWSRRKIEQNLIVKGKEFLEYVELAPTVKNAKRVLELIGIWSAHENVEKYIMNLRNEFPLQVLEEAQYLLDNRDTIPDPDERLRRDLRHLDTYTIDNENAMEIDDALSIEYLENGSEKIWIHIADVSRWIRPGSLLSLEAEQRMSSVYMPDEKINMFPDNLATDLLSLGDQCSYALSCGVTFDDNGNVTSYEICPSKIRVTRKLSYHQLDEILSQAESSVDTLSDILISNASNGLKDSKLTKTNYRMQQTSTQNTLNKYACNEDNCEEISTAQALTRKPKGESFGSIHAEVANGNESSFQTYPIVAVADMSGGQILTSGANLNASIQSNYFPEKLSTDLLRLHRWAQLRHKFRGSEGALDDYLKHHSELSLYVRRESKYPFRSSVVGFSAWSNATSMSLVSEYMVLMCQTIGHLCKSNNASVWYKIQSSQPPLSASDLALRPYETLFLRCTRILRHLKMANDSATPGPHCTSGSEAYVQCTSPIRRYHDLYNHYRIKGSLHRASLSEKLRSDVRVAEEAGIKQLDRMSSGAERLRTLNAIRLVTRHRQQYWLNQYMERLINTIPKVSFDCVVLGNHTTVNLLVPRKYEPRFNESGVGGAEDRSQGGVIYDITALQLGSGRYKMYHNDSTLSNYQPLQPGNEMKCHLYKLNNSPITHLFIPVDVSIDDISSDWLRKSIQ